MQKLYAVSDVVEDEIQACFSNQAAAQSYIDAYRASLEAQIAESEYPGSIDRFEVREISLFDDLEEVPEGYSPIDELQP